MTDFATWNPDEVATWFEDIGLPQYSELVRAEGFDGNRLRLATDELLKSKLNITSFVHRKEILRHRSKLSSGTASPPEARDPPPNQSKFQPRPNKTIRATVRLDDLNLGIVDELSERTMDNRINDLVDLMDPPKQRPKPKAPVFTPGPGFAFMSEDLELLTAVLLEEKISDLSFALGALGRYPTQAELAEMEYSGPDSLAVLVSTMECEADSADLTHCITNVLPPTITKSVLDRLTGPLTKDQRVELTELLFPDDQPLKREMFLHLGGWNK